MLARRDEMQVRAEGKLKMYDRCSKFAENEDGRLGVSFPSCCALFLYQPCAADRGWAKSHARYGEGSHKLGEMMQPSAKMRQDMAKDMHDLASPISMPS